MSGFSHFIHLVLCLLTGFFWIPVYVLCIICASNKRKRKEDRSREEQIALLKDIASQTRRNK